MCALIRNTYLYKKLIKLIIVFESNHFLRDLLTKCIMYTAYSA